MHKLKMTNNHIDKFILFVFNLVLKFSTVKISSKLPVAKKRVQLSLDLTLFDNPTMTRREVVSKLWHFLNFFP